MRRRRYVLGLAVALAVATVVEGPLAASAAGPRPDFQLPFPCGQQWRLDSWAADHQPSLDMVKEPDQTGTEGALLVAPAAGRVNQSFRHDRAGNMIQIDHGGQWFTTYIHLQSRAVGVGTRVSAGQAIGRVGKDGETSNGHPHLHFEMAIDANNNGSATWGFEGAERVPPVFDGVTYSTAAGQTYRNVTSRNCGDEERPPRLDVFARASGNGLAHRWFVQDESGWRGWETLGGTLTSAPAVASWERGRVDVFARGTTNQLIHTWYVADGNGWRSFEDLGGALASDPAVTAQ